MSVAGLGGGRAGAPIALLLAVAAAAAAASNALLFDPIPLGGISLASLGSLLAAYLVVALLIERAVELILAAHYGPEEAAARADLDEESARHRTRMSVLARDLELLVSPQDRAGLLDGHTRDAIARSREGLAARAAEAERRLSLIRQRKSRSAAIWAVLLGLGISLAGLNLLGSALGGGTLSLPEPQAAAFRLADFLASGVVLAGGALGMHGALGLLLKRAPDPEAPGRSRPS